VALDVYYNEFEAYPAQWLRNLCAAGELPDGDIDERDIKDLKANDVENYRQAHFFAGIGGWPYALQLAGFPDDVICWTGSCPCQPFSTAGAGLGTADERHLWPTWYELIKDCLPTIIFGEQVAPKAGRDWLAVVRSDLETLGYGVGAADISAAGIGSPQIRQRLWWVAYADSTRPYRPEKVAPVSCSNGEDGRIHTRDSDRFGPGPDGETDHVRLGDANSAGSLKGHQPASIDRHGRTSISNGNGTRTNFWESYESIQCADGKARPIEPGTFPLAYGVQNRVGKISAYGNAIVPEVAAQFVRSFLDVTGL